MPFDPHNVKGYYKLVGHEPIEMPDLLEWGEWFEHFDRTVRLTRVGPYTVSTIFLGMDHGFGFHERPVLFETMAWIDREHETHVPAIPQLGLSARTFKFHRDFDDYQERCSTRDEALAQHEAAIAHFRQPGDEIEELKHPAHLKAAPR